MTIFWLGALGVALCGAGLALEFLGQRGCWRLPTVVAAFSCGMGLVAYAVMNAQSPLVRTGVAFALFGVFLLLAAANWVFLVRQFTTPHGPSWTPILGGVLGVAAFSLPPFDAARQWWWLALFVDAGCVPGFVSLVPWYFFRRGRRG